MSGRISFQTCLTDRSGRISDYLSTYNGQLKLIDVVRSSLQLADYATLPQHENDHGFTDVHEFLDEIRSSLYLVKSLSTLSSLQTKIELVRAGYLNICNMWMNGDEIPARYLLKVMCDTGCLFNKILKLIAHLIFKPMVAIDKYASIGGSFRECAHAWSHLSLVRSCLEIECILGKLLLGTRRPLRKIASLIVEIWYATHHALLTLGVHLPRPLLICYALVKCSLHIYDIYEKTI